MIRSIVVCSVIVLGWVAQAAAGGLSLSEWKKLKDFPVLGPVIDTDLSVDRDELRDALEGLITRISTPAMAVNDTHRKIYQCVILNLNPEPVRVTVRVNERRSVSSEERTLLPNKITRFFAPLSGDPTPAICTVEGTFEKQTVLATLCVMNSDDGVCEQNASAL